MNSNPHFPDTSGINSILAVYRGASAYIIPMTNANGGQLGNNGDELMHRVFRRLLAELGIETRLEPSQADVIIVPPSGSLLEQYAFPALLTERLRGLEERPLIIFPSSLYFPTSDPGAIFAGRRAETLLLLREQVSYEHLEDRWGSSLERAGVRMVVDHDVVASGHAYVPEIIGATSPGKHLLIAARRDREQNKLTLDGVSGGPASFGIPKAAIKLIPYGRARTFLTRAARNRINASAAANLVESLPTHIRTEIEKELPAASCVDASATQFATFREYSRYIADAGTVVTNRLHVGLPAAIVGKRVILVEAGYHKLSGVYAQSLTSVPNVSLVNRAS